MTGDLALALAIGIGAICGAVTGRTFALEGENRRTSIFAAAYCGAGAGILSAPTLTFAAMVIAGLLDPVGSTFAAIANAAQATGPALLWGAAGGAAGGLCIGILIAMFKRYTPR